MNRFKLCFQIHIVSLLAGDGEEPDRLGAECRGAQLGRAVQVDPIKLTLKASGIKRLKLKHVKLLSRFAYKFNLRRYSLGTHAPLLDPMGVGHGAGVVGGVSNLENEHSTDVDSTNRNRAYV